MRRNPSAGQSDVRAVYEGVQARLYELFMGQQIHVGGIRSTMELADRAGLRPGERGVELCCGSGASMRALVRFRDIGSMVGIELAEAPVEKGRGYVDADGQTDRISFVVGVATQTSLPPGEADFVWGEDAWCYVPDKEELIAEAVRLTRPGGTIAFTDWVEGPVGLSDTEAEHVMQMMTFPSLGSLEDYRSLLKSNGCDVHVAEDSGRFGPSFRLYADTLKTQLGFDALEMLDWSTDLLDVVITELEGLSRLGYEEKLIQARFVART